MKYCKECIQPDTRPGIEFNKDGICNACMYEKTKKYINWDERREKLGKIVEEAKRISKNGYQCAIGVSGGKDSTLQAIYAKEKLGLNALLVNSEPDNITEIGRRNMDTLSNHGFDIIKLKPNPKILKELVKKSFYEFGNILKPSEYSLYASTYIIADKFDIPLVIQGENAALTLGVTNTGLGEDDNALNINEGNTLAGGSASDWISDNIGIEKLNMYQFPNKNELTDKGIRAIYLQYYLEKWSQVYNADFAISRGMLGRSEESLYDIGRYRRYTALDSDLAIVNQMLKYYKFGFGFATDEACYDIREGRLDRDEAIWLVEEYDGKCSEKYIESFCEYINITNTEFRNTLDRLVNKDLFKKNNTTRKWEKRFKVGVDFY